MSNISRRDFLKTAGVMTLAVAAAGVLAGCDAKPVTPPETTVNTFTANNYTLTLKDVKQYDAVDVAADGAKTAEGRYVVALLSLKVVDATVADYEKSAEVFHISELVKNMGANIAVDAEAKDKIDATRIAALFDLTAANVKACTDGSIKGYNAATLKKDEAMTYVVAYKVDAADKTASDVEPGYKTPSLTFVAQETKTYAQASFAATIPAAQEINRQQLMKTTA